jgi:hypothetical protein
MFGHEITNMPLKAVVENYAKQNAKIECFANRVFVIAEE